MSAQIKTALWRQNQERFEYWHVSGGTIRFRRPGELAFKSMPEHDFWRHYTPESEPEQAARPQAVQGGLFG